jgi:acetoin utilization deacetylase AcuC-like enzyme
MRLTNEGFGAIAGLVKSIADQCCKGMLAATLEGGYNLEAQAEAVVSEIRAFQGSVPDVKGFDPAVAKRIEEVKKVQSAYWDCFK